MLSRVAGLVVRKPLATLAVVLVAGAWGTIAVNAVLLQEGPHPAPFLVDPAPDTRVSTAVPPPNPARSDPARRVNSVAPAGIDEESVRRAEEARAVLVGDIQAALARRNFYSGALDGRFGPQTEAAIRDYEKAAGLAETGEPSEELLAHVRLSTLTAPPIPVPSPLRSAATPPAPVPAASGQSADQSAGQSSGQPVRSAAATPPPPTPPSAPREERADDTAAPKPVKTITISGTGDPVAELLARSPTPSEPIPTAPLVDGRIESVQRILAELGYAPGSIDGQMNAATRRAIEDFQIDRGLPVTGDLSPRFIDELSSVSGEPLG